MSPKLAKLLCAAAVVLTAAAAAPTAVADAMMSESAPARVITVPKDKSLSFRLDEPATKIVVAQPDIAEVVATTDRSFYVRGVDLGTTNLLVYGAGSRLMEVIDVRVGVDAAALQQDIAQALPREHVNVQNLGQGVVLTGRVTSPGAALRAKAIAERFAPDGVTNMLKVDGSQVVLEVRILEANRSWLQDLGLGATISSKYFNYAFGGNLVGAPVTPPGGQPPLVGLAGNGQPNGALRFLSKVAGASVDGQIAALEEKGILRTLARPNLVALSGEKASFLAGGEFPFPVPAGNAQVTIEFRPYGVKLNFIPTIQDDGTIRLEVAPEVSALDPSNTIRLNGISIPALTVRRTSTTVEMHGGDSLAIGGLFQHGYENDVKQVPGLGEIPILSALFRSTRWKRNETELLIVVTPRLLTPADMHAPIDLPGREPGLARMLLNGDVLDKPLSNDLRGPAEPTVAFPPVAKAAPAPKTAVATAAPKAAPPKPAPVIATAAPAAPKPAATKATMASPIAAVPPPKPVTVAPITTAAAAKAPAPAPTTAANAPKPAAATPIPTATTSAFQPAKATPIPLAVNALKPIPAALTTTAATPSTPPTLRGEIPPKAASTGK